jgi:hypothetical protein
MPVAGEQPHAVAVALNDQAIAVVLDFVYPVRTRHGTSPRASAGKGANVEFFTRGEALAATGRARTALRTGRCTRAALAAPIRTAGGLRRRYRRKLSRPTFGGVETDYADRVGILPVQHVANDDLPLGVIGVHLVPDPAKPAEVIQHKISVPIVVARHNGR